MHSPQDQDQYSCLTLAYRAGMAAHGDFGLALEAYIDHLNCVRRKYLGESPSSEESIRFLGALHTSDLYLSVACFQGSESAWSRLAGLYQKPVLNLARLVSRTTSEACDLAEALMGSLFLPDASGRSRIASYEGRGSLLGWLASIVWHTATKERERKCNKELRLNELSEIPDWAILEEVERQLHSSSYVRMIGEPLITATKSLTRREKLILVLRYKEGLPKSDIARIVRLHPSNIGRQMERVHEKLRTRIVAILESKHGLSSKAVEEILIDVDLVEREGGLFLNSLTLDD